MTIALKLLGTVVLLFVAMLHARNCINWSRAAHSAPSRGSSMRGMDSIIAICAGVGLITDVVLMYFLWHWNGF